MSRVKEGRLCPANGVHAQLLTAAGDYINATIGFHELGGALGKRPSSLMRMLGPTGNPTAENLFSLIAFLQENEGVTLNVASQPVSVSGS